MPFIINDETPTSVYMPGQVRVADKPKGHGLVPRDYALHPVGYMGPLCPPMAGVDMPLIPESDWHEIIKEQKATKSRLSDIRRNMHGPGKPMKSLDQGSSNFCWTHSGTGAVMMLNAVANRPHVRLSAFAVACVLTGFKNDGGWGAWGLEKMILSGIPDITVWPERSMARANDNPATWANAAQNKVTESWMDLEPPVYNRTLSRLQVATCLLNRIPVIGDFNFWRHSVVLLDWEEIEPGSFGPRGLNSWSDEWGDLGEFLLQGSKSNADGATAPRVVTGG